MSEKGTGASGKEVLYIDVDDEITAIIDKVRSSHQKIVALVLPKRASVFQSIVNMKLLKRGAEASKKNVVLITSEVGLLPMAGMVGIHVARSLQSKPEIPEVPTRMDDEEGVEEIADHDNDESKPGQEKESSVDKTRTIGELAGAAALDDQLDDEIDLGDEPEQGISAVASKLKPKKGKDKKLKVPNFKKFRVLIIFGSLAIVALIVFMVLAFTVLPKATISIQTDSSAVNSSSVVQLTTGTNVKLSTSSSIVPATAQQTQKTSTQQVPATGQQNNGAKASGSIKLTNCSAADVTIPAGSGFSAAGKTFISQSAVVVSDSNFTSPASGSKCKNDGTASVNVVAQNGGADANLSAQGYTLASALSGVTAQGSEMTGGTDQITKIVTQGDIDGAKQKLSAADTTSIKQELKTALIAKSLYVVETSFNAGTPTITGTAKAGDPADNVTVTSSATYSMLGVKQDDLKTIVKDSVKTKIDPNKQKILEYGLSNAVFGLQSQNPDGATVTMQTTVIVGSELNVATIKKQIAGKKAGDAQSIIKQYPGVTNVTVRYSPFWVNSIPKSTGKITVTVQKPTAASGSSDATKP